MITDVMMELVVARKRGFNELYEEMHRSISSPAEMKYVLGCTLKRADEQGWGSDLRAVLTDLDVLAALEYNDCLCKRTTIEPYCTQLGQQRVGIEFKSSKVGITQLVKDNDARIKDLILEEWIALNDAWYDSELGIDE